jgi:hypothetical protein
MTKPEPEPFLVPGGYTDSYFIPSTGGPSYRLLRYADGAVRFEHRCNRGDRGTIICAPSLRNHEVDLASFTVSPSILCPDCGLHGFVRDGRWVSA